MIIELFEYPPDRRARVDNMSRQRQSVDNRGVDDGLASRIHRQVNLFKIIVSSESWKVLMSGVVLTPKQMEHCWHLINIGAQLALRLNSEPDHRTNKAMIKAINNRHYFHQAQLGAVHEAIFGDNAGRLETWVNNQLSRIRWQRRIDSDRFSSEVNGAMVHTALMGLKLVLSNDSVDYLPGI